MTESNLTSSDRSWLDALRERVRDLEDQCTPRPLQRVFLLRAIRARLRTDYLFWGYGVQDPRTFDSLMAEYFDDCDDAILFDEGGSPAAKTSSAYARYSWAAMTLNGAHPTNRVLCDLIRATDQPQVTVDQDFLLSCTSLGTKLRMLMRPRLLLRRHEVGLDDFMITMRRHGENAGGAIGYHRAFRSDGASGHRSPSERFSARDRDLADSFSREFDEILHTVRIDLVALEEICRQRRLNYWERVAFPMLMSDRFDEADIAVILRVKRGRVGRIRRDVCSKIGTGTERRRSLQALFHPHPRDSRWKPHTAQLSLALRQLQRDTSRWEPGFVDQFEEPSLRERANGKRRAARKPPGQLGA